jgi:hypothetical protein
MAEVIVTRIRNRTSELVTIAHQQRGTVELEPGADLEGPFLYKYDPDREGPIPSPNEAWFVDSTTSFVWGTVAMPTPDAQFSDPD